MRRVHEPEPAGGRSVDERDRNGSRYIRANRHGRRNPGPEHGARGCDRGRDTPRCHTRDLAGSFTVVVGSAGMGNIDYAITLTNIAPHPCTLYGYPGLLLLDMRSAPLPTNVLRIPDSAKRLITLPPGGIATAFGRFTPDVPGAGDNTTVPSTGAWACQPTAVYTRITPPDETTHLVVKVTPPTPVCQSGLIQVSAFAPGAEWPPQP